jgi:hypothetical protein
VKLTFVVVYFDRARASACETILVPHMHMHMHIAADIEVMITVTPLGYEKAGRWIPAAKSLVFDLGTV